MESPKTMEGKCVLFVAVGQDMTKYMLYRHLSTLSVKLVVLENPDNVLASELLREGYVDEFLRLDLTSRPTLVEECIQLIDQSAIKIDGILTFWDDAVGLAVRLSEHYSLPGSPIRSVDVAHDKYLTRWTLNKLGYPSPRFLTVVSESQLFENVKNFDFPIILKPLYGAASIGVVKVDCIKELAVKYRQAKQNLEEELESGGLMGLKFEGPEDELHDVRTFCVEEFLKGSEFDCDVVMYNGEIIYAKAVDNLPLQPPHFCEIMELCPVSRGPETAQRVEDYACRILQGLGFINGVFHVEVIDDTKYGPVLVEINPRMGGGPMRGIHKRVFGVDLAEQALKIALGIRPQIENHKLTPNIKCVTINLHAISSGRLKSDGLAALDFLKDNPAADYWLNVNKKDELLCGWKGSYPSKAGRIQLIYENISSEEAIERANDILNTFNHNLAGLTESVDDTDVPPTDFYTARHLHFNSSV